MKYTPRLPTKNDNVSHQHPLKEFAVLVAGATGLLVAVFFVLGFFVDTSVQYIEPVLEAQIFNAISSPHDAPQTEQEQKLQALVNTLSECIDVGYPLHVSISESDEMNAFAIPGGSIVVLEGLLDQVSTNNGVAFVLAHELAHFKNRDHLRGFGRAIVLLSASVLLTGANSDLSSLLTPLFSAEAAQHSQERERQADISALHALNCAYGNVDNATEFFERIAESSDNVDWKLMHYFSSHPEAQQRIDTINALAQKYRYLNR